MEQMKPYYEKHILVCVNVREEPNKESCGPKGSPDIHQRLKDYVRKSGLNRRIRVSKTYCQDLCSFGPIVSIYPDNVVYKGVSLEDVDEIIKRHVDVLKEES